MSWKSALTVVLAAACLAVAPMSESAAAQGRGRGVARGRALDRQAQSRHLPRSQQEPAFARGYDEGYQHGLADGKRGNRYDPADSAEYRNGDQGYANAYGSRDAYRNNYRAGFRQGYEAGYREATR